MEKEKKSTKYSEIRELMKNLELFRDVEDKNLDLMIEFSHIDTYFSNSVLCRENEPKLINHIKDLFDKRVVTAKKSGKNNESNLMKKNLFFKFKKLFGIK